MSAAKHHTKTHCDRNRVWMGPCSMELQGGNQDHDVSDSCMQECCADLPATRQDGWMSKRFAGNIVVVWYNNEAVRVSWRRAQADVRMTGCRGAH